MISLTRPEKFNPKFEVVSCFMEHDGDILLLHRQDHKPQGNTWAVPAGKVEEGETLAAAIMREVEEEIGHKIRENELNYFREVYVIYPEYQFIYHIFRVKLSLKPEFVLDMSAHKDLKWVPVKESLSMNLIQDEDACIKLCYNL